MCVWLSFIWFCHNIISATPFHHLIWNPIQLNVLHIKFVLNVFAKMAALQWSRTKIFNDMQVKIAQCDRVRVRVRVCFICHHANQSLFIYLFHTRFFSVRRNKCIHTDGSGSIHAIDAISTCMQLLLNWNSSAAIMILYLVSVHFFSSLGFDFFPQFAERGQKIEHTRHRCQTVCRFISLDTNSKCPTDI